ncbi:MAG TPA: hypothetical protein VKU00_04935, partial [Chthonomonadaceae bacterium]|nr:hypothetical protein [Chthonomonadaceae bacterium]
KLGVEIPHGSVLIGELVGSACQAIGRKDIWSEMDHLNAGQSRKAIQRLESILARQVPYADTLQEEKWFGQSALLEVFRQKNAIRQMMASANGQSNSGGNPPVDFTQLFWLAYSKERVMADYTHYMDQLIANNHQPYGAHVPDPPVPNDPICQIICPVFTQAHFNVASSNVQNHLLLTALALHAYQLEHGAYPNTLQELVPGYLAKLPQDEMAKQGMFLYQSKAKDPSHGVAYLLYSVGPDGVDDGGRPIDDPSKVSSGNPTARYRPDVQSNGDIVVGVNVP